MKSAVLPSIVSLGLLASLAACEAASVGSVTDGGSSGGASEDVASSSPGSTPVGRIELDSGISPTEAGSGTGGACKTAQAVGKMQPTRLGFVIDVSGSMGAADKPWHDKSLKWAPVVAAAKGFFGDPNSRGIEVSLGFFPTGNDDVKCLDATYATPQVPMTGLPSAAFEAAVDEQGPNGYGTPTVPVIQGTLSYLRAQRQTKPGKYAMVLATDGYPEGCTDTNDITHAAAAVAEALAGGIPTFVIGVRNPPISGAPDVTSNLSQIASAGGTTVFFLDTGNPTQTEQAFSAAVNQIRSTTIDCNIPIPDPPEGRTFDKEKVSVTYAHESASDLPLGYDPNCATTNSWHYDNPINPTDITLCPNTCSTVQADTSAVLTVTFTCDQVITVIL